MFKKGHRKIGGRIKGSGAMSIEEFRKIVYKVNPKFIEDYIKDSDPVLRRTIFERLVPLPKETTVPTIITIHNHIPE